MIASPSRTPFTRNAFGLALLFLSLALFSFAPLAQSGSATWSGMPASDDWNTANNWMPATVPNGSGDVATFANSEETEVAEINFQAGADAFTISNLLSHTLTIGGTGIVNESSTEQNFVVGSPNTYDTIWFRNSATAGALTRFTINGGGESGGSGGLIWFWDNSTAGEATYITKGASAPGGGYGYVQFFAQASAGNGMFQNEGATLAGAAGGASFVYEALAGNATFVNEPGTVSGGVGGTTQITTQSSAENATFVNIGATVAATVGRVVRSLSGEHQPAISRR